MQFIDHQLSAEEKAESIAWYDSEDTDFFAVLNEIVLAGHRIAITNDTANKCVVVTIIGRSKTCVNYDRAMTTRHYDVYQALLMAAYKHAIIYKHEAWDAGDGQQMFG